jgi:hypothetical protein
MDLKIAFDALCATMPHLKLVKFNGANLAAEFLHPGIFEDAPFTCHSQPLSIAIDRGMIPEALVLLKHGAKWSDIFYTYFSAVELDLIYTIMQQAGDVQVSTLHRWIEQNPWRYTELIKRLQKDGVRFDPTEHRGSCIFKSY